MSAPSAYVFYVVHIEKINGPFLSEFKGSPAEYSAGLKLAIERGWLWLHESGTCVRITERQRRCSPDRRETLVVPQTIARLSQTSA
jgi:hypothetical protein